MSNAPRNRAADAASSDAERAALLASLVDHSTAHIFAKDLEGRFQFVNAPMAARLGGTPTSLLGRTLHDVLPAEEADRLCAYDRQALRTLASVEAEVRVPYPDGTERVMSTWISPLLDGDGRPYAIAGVAQDVTAERQAVQAAREAQELLDLAASAGRSLAYDWDLISDVAVRSAQAMEILGCGPEGLRGLGAEWFAGVLAEDRPTLDRAVAALTPDNNTWSVVYRYRRPDGRVIALHDAGRATFDAQGRLIRVRGMSRDVTAEQQTQAALAESEARLRAIVDHSPNEIFLQDADGRFLFINQTMASRLAFPMAGGPGSVATAVLGRRVDELLPAAYAEQLRACEKRALAEKRPIDVEVRVPGPDRSERLLAATLVPLLDDGGRPYALCGIARDVTAQRQATALLVLAAAATRSLAFDWNVVTGQISRSPETLAALGIDPRSLSDRIEDWFANVHPEDLPRLRSAFAGLTPARDTYDVTYRCRLADGTEVTLRDAGRGSFDEAGHLVRVRGMSRDIREEAAVQAALRASELSLTLALEASDAGIWDLDLARLAGTWSDGYYRLLGYAPGEVEATMANWLSRVHPDDRDAVAEQARQFAEKRSVSRWDVRMRWPDGSDHWLRYHGREPAEAPGHVRGVVIDITDLRRVQDEVRALNAELEQRVRDRTAALEAEVVERRRAQSESARLSAIVESTSDLVAVASMPDGRLVYGNRALRDTLGRELTGLPMAEALPLTHPPDDARRMVDEAIPTALREGRWRGVNRVRRADGGTMPVQQDVFVTRSAGGQVVEMSSIMRDASDQVRVEQALRERAEGLALANAELARATRMKDEFLANMSHELRTPLNAVLGVAEALREEVYGPIGDRQREVLNTVEQSGRQLLGVINDVLDLARIEAGKLALEFAPVAVEAACRASLAMVETAARAKGVEVSFTPDSEAPVVSGDERRLIQVLVNLLVNAVKFTPAGGRVHLTVHGDRANGVVEASVADDGIGIAAADLERIFQPFAQLDAGLDRRFGGSGLGLSIVQRLVDLHGGSVRVESEPGRGSRFTVSLPWRAAATAAAAATRESGAPLSGAPLVLVVDDSEVNARVVADFLGAHGCRVRVAGDGAEALRLVQDERPAVVLMDIQMPGMDGLEATRALRAMPGMDGLPILALTALAMPGDRERCLAAGATDYLAKPVSLAGLLARVRALL